ncbi:hypothetical protein R1T16_18250 [Flavobacterium sp. DG1-102-2]|uniref:hypothetical protein n=1 Tax=Flavobacterium sp. DG1-102-2 TaxID=3081663 RepID=UPI002949FBE5|nr:hypothetical protein [Flavobacterium sp. DG1-102-2]MDV6170383.1 hypothetical protein [Flavobacterium sp. DG1-102-2]
MKHLLVFTVLLANSFLFKLNACGFYPWGEEVRFCYLKPKSFNFDDGYNYFNYTSNWYDYENYSNDDHSDGDYAGVNYYKPNVSLWQEYCNGKVSYDEVVQAIYKIELKDVNEHSKNGMLRYLYVKKDTEAIDYIVFAKKCEQYTWNNVDPWEKNQNKDLSSVAALVKEASFKAGSIKNNQIKRRYLFLRVRLDFYYGKSAEIVNTYNRYFKKSQDKDLLYYWVMFYYTQTVSNPAEQNYYAAQVFAHAADRRFVVRSNYDRDIAIEETLQFAQTKEEAANIWLLHGVRITGKGIKYLANIYKNDPSSKGLEFMLLREINKLEDWILTPQYSLFEPSTRADYWENNNAQRILERVKVDRQYADDMLKFINTVKFSATNNPVLWRMAQAYVAFMAQENEQAVTAINKLNTEINEEHPLYESSKLIKGLVLVAAQEQDKAIIPDEVKRVILEQHKKGNLKYLFGIGRELENKGNTTLACQIFSKCDVDNESNDWRDSANWRGRNNIVYTYTDYYWNYISYIDGCYTIAQMHDIIRYINSTAKESEFDKWLSKNTKMQKSEFYKILGAKYLRENRLREAHDVFKNIEEKGDYDFAENPFYKIKNTPEFTNLYNKNKKVTRAYIIDNLMKVIARAEDKSEKNRDYYYFLAGNCYYNMSFFGNVWNIRRRFMSGSQSYTGFSDDDEFFQCKSAAKYYALAYKNAKTEKFRVLCLRMMSECERNRLYNENDKYWRYNGRYDYEAKRINRYDVMFHKLYKDDYEELTSNCTAFSDYFKARR